MLRIGFQKGGAMRDKREIIHFIEAIKSNVKENRYNSKEKLQNDFYKVKEYIWEDIDNIKESDLTNISHIHNYLIDEVCKVHSVEKDEYNKELFKSSLNIRDIKGQLKDGKRACDIYTFTNSWM